MCTFKLGLSASRLALDVTEETHDPGRFSGYLAGTTRRSFAGRDGLRWAGSLLPTDENR